MSEARPGHYRVEGDVGPRTLSAIGDWCSEHGVLPRELSTGQAQPRGRLPRPHRTGAALVTALSSAPGGLAPRPGSAPRVRVLAAQTRAEIRMTLRNGEQLLLTLVIPLLLLVGLSKLPADVVQHSPAIDAVAPGILALAVISTAFTGQAIATGFERRYGVLKLLGATPLGRSGLLVAKTLGVLVVEVVQIALITGRRPRARLAPRRQCGVRRAPGAPRDRGVLLARAAARRHAAGRGDAGRRQRPLPPAARRRRGRHPRGPAARRARAARRRCCRRPRSARACATSCSTARACPCTPSSC